MKSLVSDWIGVAIIVGGLAFAIAIVCLIYVAWENSGSRNLALAAGTVVAAIVLFALQIPLELRTKTETDAFGAEFMIDRLKPEIRANYSMIRGWRMAQDLDASNALATTNPGAFMGDAGGLTVDMTIRSLLAYLFAEQFDWQIKNLSVKGTMFGTLISVHAISKEKDCTKITSKQIVEKLAKSGNQFTGGRLLQEYICLPPGSSLDIQKNFLTIRTPFVLISFVVEQTGGVRSDQPGSGEGNNPALTNGAMQFETLVNRVSVNTEYPWIRAEHRDMDRYKAWADRIVSGAKQWFEIQAAPWPLDEGHR